MILSNASLKRPIAMTTLIFLMMVFGVFSYFRLGLDFLPKIDFPYVTVMTVYPGAGPEDVETLVSRHIEDAVSEVDGVKHINSVSMDNVSQVIIEFELGTDVDTAANDVRAKIDLVRRKLPDDADAPSVLKFDPNAMPIMNLVLIGDAPLDKLYRLADGKLRDRLIKIRGVASVDVVGGRKREIQIRADQNRLNAYSLTMMSIVQALAKENIQIPGGHITEPGMEYSIKLDGEYTRVDEIRKMTLTTPLGKTIPLTDVVKIIDGFEEPRDMARYDGVECVGLTVTKRSDANTVKVAERIKQSMNDISALLPAGVRLKIVNDSSTFIQASARDVMITIFFGIGLTAAILLLFLHNIRQTLIASIAMPVSIVATFSLIYFAGFTLNVMSLMALGLGVGILVTNAIVVLENIERHLGMDGHAGVKDAVEKGTSEVAVAVLGSTLTNVVVFVPIAFMTSMAGQMFIQFGMTMIFATLVSMFISFTLTPIMANMLLKKSGATIAPDGRPIIKGGFGGWWEKRMDGLSDRYRAAIGWALANRLLVSSIAVSLFIATLSIAPHLGTEMLKTPDRGKLTISVEMPAGTPMSGTIHTFDTIEKRLNDQFKDIVTGVFVKIGKVDGGLGKSSEGTYLGQALVNLTNKSARSETMDEVVDRLRVALKDIPAVKILVQASSAVGGAEQPILLDVQGNDLNALGTLAGKITQIAESTKGAADVDTSWRPGRPEIRITPKRKRIADYGLSVADLGMMLRANLEGIVASTFRVGGDDYDIRVNLTRSDRATVDQIRQFRIPTPAGTVPLSMLADIHETLAPTRILRKDKQRNVMISASPAGRPLGDVVADMQAKIDAMGLPPGYTTHFSGMVEIMRDTFADLGMAFGMAVVLTYLALAALLESWIQPFSIMLTLPLAFIGVFIALLITGNPISMFGMMSFVMLVGIVVNNAILIIEYTTMLRKQGVSRRDALLIACPIKLRPILMTMAATIIAMLPIALGFGWGAEIRAPMAIVTIGGLLASTALSLFVIPVIYTAFDDLAARVTGRTPPAGPDSDEISSDVNSDSKEESEEESKTYSETRPDGDAEGGADPRR